MATESCSRPKPRRKAVCRVYIVRRSGIRELNVRPWFAWTTALVSLVFFALYFAATGYLVFRDDLLAASFARTARQKQAYEDRIAALRSDIDRLASRQFLDQEEFEARLAEVADRQQALDARQDLLADLGRAAQSAGIVPPDPKTSDRRAAADDDALITGSIESTEEPDAVELLAIVEDSLDAIAESQVAYIEKIAETAAERSDRIAAVLTEIGRGVPAPKNTDAIGGPFVPMPGDVDPETFRDGVAIVTGEIERFEALHRKASGLPLMAPMSGARVTSRFGMRTDPFRRRPAMHTGIDYRAPTGQDARATAAGKVISAGYSGGYGNMVEIDHGGGLTTRFAHLSKVVAKKGQTVARGDVIGRTGSTGRSTGPHLHYEIRVNGRAVDPMTFIRAGEKLDPVL